MTTVSSPRLTPRQQQILDLIRRTIQQSGIPPTRAEIAQALGFRSTNAAVDHLRALARKGAIELSSGTSRGIRLLPAASGLASNASISNDSSSKVSPSYDGNPAATPHAAKMHSAARGVAASNQGYMHAISTSLILPLVGRVAAGSPILAAEHIARQVGVDPSLFSEKPDYLLTVRGLSMRDAGILEGDLLAVRKTSEARSGQIVVARLGDDVTVKRLHRTNHTLQLLPENPDFEPIDITDDDEFALEGVAVGLIRPHGLN